MTNFDLNFQLSGTSQLSSTFCIFFFISAPLVDILNGTALLAMRSITSKLVAVDELGKNKIN